MINFENLTTAFIRRGELSPECHPDYYRSMFPDLAALPEKALTAHYDRYGRSEGRTGSPSDLRTAFVSSIDPSARVLEIGPFTAATVRGEKTEYFDVLDADGLRQRASAHGFPVVEPVRIDFVSPTGDLSVVPKGFDVVYSAHCIEHTPDMIAHLQEVHRILNPGGLYMLTVPDMRFTFDHYRTPTTAEDILAAHAEGRKVHAPEDVISYMTESTHNDPVAHWAGEHGPSPRPDIEERRLLAEAHLADANGGYVDIHAWFYTPESFRTLMETKAIRKETGFSVERVYNTPYGYNEFNAVLRRTS